MFVELIVGLEFLWMGALNIKMGRDVPKGPQTPNTFRHGHDFDLLHTKVRWEYIPPIVEKQ